MTGGVQDLPPPLSPASSVDALPKRVLVPIADGSEGTETACIMDTLSRFDADVYTASVLPDGVKLCRLSRGLNVVADITIDEAEDDEWDLIVCPGGMQGARILRESKPLSRLLLRQKAQNKMYAGICAAPSIVLATQGLLEPGATCYPATILRSNIQDASDEDVVVQGNVVTSQGPGTSLLFALQLGEQLYGKEKADEIAKILLVMRGDWRGALTTTNTCTPPKLPKTPKTKVVKREAKAKNETPRDRKSHSGNTKKPSKTDLFWHIVWPRLEKLGWHKETGSRSSDAYYFPPGVTRGPGFLSRKDFFDSRSQVEKCLEDCGTWNQMKEVKELLELFSASKSTLSELAAKKETPPDFSLEWLEKETKRRNPGLEGY